MYNEERKKAYLAKATNKKNAVMRFNEIEPFEERLGKDLCEMSKEELQSIADQALGVLPSSLVVSVDIIVSYRKWCEKNGYAVFPLEYPIRLDPTKRIRQCMVPSPKELQTILDETFDPPGRETVDCLYRCFFWMAFAGIPSREEALNVKTEEVDLENLIIRHGGLLYELDYLALPSFRIACTVDSFFYEHPKYRKLIRRKRMESPYLMRSLRSKKISRGAFQKALHDHLTKYEKGARISYHRVWYSGLFYRAYQMEQEGFPPNFDSVRFAKMSQNRKYDIKMDYAAWKKAFSL